MNKKGPIVIIEDDPDDQMMLTEVFKILKIENEIRFFGDGDAALIYLRQPDVYPFLILSDVNMPKLNGLELKRMVHTNEALSVKCIPYLFFTTAVNEKAVYDAYTMSAQGFFVKPNSFDELVATLDVMIEYWKCCYSPSNFNGQPVHLAEHAK
jgi:CheY-like chemotaxis protein